MAEYSSKGICIASICNDGSCFASFRDGLAPANWGRGGVGLGEYSGNTAIGHECNQQYVVTSLVARATCCGCKIDPEIFGRSGKLEGAKGDRVISSVYCLFLSVAMASLRISSKLRSLISCFALNSSSTRPRAWVDNVCTNCSRMSSIVGAGAISFDLP